MKIRHMHEHLLRTGIHPTALNKMTPEVQVRTFLEHMNPAVSPKNRDGDDIYRSKLIGASAMLAHLLPGRIKEPEKMMDALMTAYSERGACIFPKEAVYSAFNRVINDAKKSNPGISNKIDRQPNYYLKRVGISAFNKDREHRLNDLRYFEGFFRSWNGVDKLHNLAETQPERVVKMLDDPDEEVRGAAVSVLGSHPDLAKKYSKRLSKLFDDPDEDVRGAAVSVLGSHPDLAKKYSKNIVEKLSDRQYVVRDATLFAFGHEPMLLKRALRENPQEVRDLEILKLSKLVDYLEDSRKIRGKKRVSREALKLLRQEVFKVKKLN